MRIRILLLAVSFLVLSACVLAPVACVDDGFCSNDEELLGYCLDCKSDEVNETFCLDGYSKYIGEPGDFCSFYPEMGSISDREIVDMYGCKKFSETEVQWELVDRNEACGYKNNTIVSGGSSDQYCCATLRPFDEVIDFNENHSFEIILPQSNIVLERGKTYNFSWTTTRAESFDGSENLYWSLSLPFTWGFGTFPFEQTSVSYTIPTDSRFDFATQSPQRILLSLHYDCGSKVATCLDPSELFPVNDLFNEDMRNPPSSVLSNVTFI